MPHRRAGGVDGNGVGAVVEPVGRAGDDMAESGEGEEGEVLRARPGIVDVDHHIGGARRGFVDADHLVMELVSGEGCSFAGRDNDLLDLVEAGGRHVAEVGGCKKQDLIAAAATRFGDGLA